ncbi:MAG: hypothetical protein ABF811_00465 [Pseudoclavibacter sp.]
MDQQERREYFDALYGRAPEPAAADAAHTAGEFQTEQVKVPPADLPHVWALAYESRYGHKPSFPEFSAAKGRGFELSTLKGNPAESNSPISGDGTAAGSEAAFAGTGVYPTVSMTTPLEAPWHDDGLAALVADAKSEEPYRQDAQSTDTSAQSRSPEGVETPVQPARIGAKIPLPRHVTRWVWLGVGAACFVWAAVSAGYYFANYFGASPTGFSFYWTHQSSELNRYVQSYNAHGPLSPKTLRWYVWSDTKKPIAAADLKHKPNLPSSITAAAGRPRHGLLPGTSMQRTGTQYLLFPKYQVVVTPQKLALHTDVPDLTLSVAGSDVGTSDSASYTRTLNRVFPGSYNVAAKGVSNQVKVDLRQSVKATTGTARANFNLQFVTFHLYSNVLDGDVYVGTSKIGTLSGGDYKFNQIPVLVDQQLRVQKIFPDGVVKTRSIPVSDVADGSSVYLNWSQGLTQSAASDLFSNAESILSDLTDGYSSGNVASVFDGGTSNPVYVQFKQNAVTNIASPIPGFTPSSIGFSNVTVNEIKQTGVNTYDVTWSIDWDFSFSDVGNADGTQTASGEYSQTGMYVSQVKYVPGSNAAGESSTTSGSNGQSQQSDGSSSSSSTDANATGNDSTNFLIASLNKDFTITNQKNDVTVEPVD